MGWIERVVLKHIIIMCKPDISGKLLFNTGSSARWCDDLEGWGGAGRDAREGGDICILVTDLMLLCKYRNLHSIVKNMLLFTLAKSCPTLCNPIDWSTPGFPVPYYLSELAQVDVHWADDVIQSISSSYALFSLYLQFFPASGSFQ